MLEEETATTEEKFKTIVNKFLRFVSGLKNIIKLIKKGTFALTRHVH
jgi:hypothetical protein